MSIAVTEEHQELGKVVRSFLHKHDARKAARVALDGEGATLPFWTEMSELGWPGLHLPEEFGGSGCGLLELAIVAEGLGRECTPGPFLPTVVVSAAIAAAGTQAQKRRWLPGLATGTVTAALGVRGSLSVDAGIATGNGGPVLCAGATDLLALVVGDDLVIIDTDTRGVTVERRSNLDPTRPSAVVRCEAVELPAAAVVTDAGPVVMRTLAVLAAAEAAGGAATCREMATEYAKLRTAFGQQIGAFQAVKHHCTNMLIDEQLAIAAAWNAARCDDPSRMAVLAQAATAVALPAYLRCAKLNIQVHGGIGFTWEHDAHLFLRRAIALTAIGEPGDAGREAVSVLGIDPPATERVADLTAGAERFRDEVRRFVAAYLSMPEPERFPFLVDSGYLFPHWPKPWGRAAGPIEQLVIDEELRAIPRAAALGPTAWTLPINLPTIIAHGTDDQRERWIRPTMEGRLTWCQLLSEPGAGSDLASLTTRAIRTEGGWLVTGQKVWTSNAQDAALGFALVRTNLAAPKHAGITCMVIDMASPGITIRPLRQISGEAEFNEVFLDDVFVPDENVLGDVDRGWNVARTSLGHERVSLGESSWAPPRVRRFIDDLAAQAASKSPAVRQELGDLAATSVAVKALTLRAAGHAVTGADGAVGGSLTKLIRAEHAQRLADFCVRILGGEALFDDGPYEEVMRFVLHSRAATIAGGTSEIMRNVIAERILGLPRDKVA